MFRDRLGQFNVIHPASGLKVDFMIADDSVFNRSRFDRIRPASVGSDAPVFFASPEDVILRKLQEGGSEKHVRDIRGILRLCAEPIDEAYIDAWARVLGVTSEWHEARLLG